LPTSVSAANEPIGARRAGCPAKSIGGVGGVPTWMGLRAQCVTGS
jgi:hypothetical protein